MRFFKNVVISIQTFLSFSCQEKLLPYTGGVHLVLYLDSQLGLSLQLLVLSLK